MFESELKKLKELYKEGTFDFEMYHGKVTSDKQFDSYEKFQSIGFSCKDDIRKTGPFERTPVSDDEIYGLFSSSGTTGAKTYYVFSKEDKLVHEIFVRRFYNELGVRSCDIGAVCAPVETGIMAHTMMWQFTTMGAGYVNCPIPSPDNIAELVENMPVTVVATRPDITTPIAFIPELRKKVSDSSVKKLLLGGNIMSESRRSLLEKAWGADAYNMFGMSEMFGPMAGECRYKNGQHFPNDYLMIEIIDPDTKEPVKLGEKGVAVYTSLWKKGFPLLRYWTDDIMYITSEKCRCGSDMPRFYYQGRLSDCIKLAGNNEKTEYVFPIMVENITIPYGITEYKIERDNEKFNVSIECEKRSPELNEMEDSIINLLKSTREQVNFTYYLHGGLNYNENGKGKRLFDSEL